MQFQARHAVAQIHQRRAGILPHHAVRRAERGNPADALRLDNRLVRAAIHIEALASPIPGAAARCQQAFHNRAHLLAGIPHALTVSATPAASQSWNGPISQLKPARIARSTLAASSAISGRQSAA